jgi:hypothetical protein
MFVTGLLYVGAKLKCQSPALWDRGTEAADQMSVVLMSK